jgi:hypothetical protein
MLEAAAAVKNDRRVLSMVNLSEREGISWECLNQEPLPSVLVG